MTTRNTRKATTTATTEATKEVITMATKAPTKPRKAPAKVKAKPATKAPANLVNLKPEPTPKIVPTVITIAVDGVSYDLKEGADVAAIQKASDEVAKAAQAIADKDGELLDSYMALGSFASGVAPLFKSTKLYGQYLAKAAPASATLDPALRSNCKWLYEAVNVDGADGSDLLIVLGVNQIADYKSGNPTVIKRAYKEATKKADKLAKATDKGIDTSDEEQACKDVDEAEKAAADRKMKTATTKAIKSLIAYVGQHDDKDDCLVELADCLKEMFTEHKGQQSQIDYLASLA